MRLTLCIVGCGQYARSVLDDIHGMTEEIELFFASRDLGKAKEYCETFGGTDYFGNYEAAVSDPRVAAVYFFTPHHMHLENALLAARHSKHILMEKPIARTIEESKEMIGAARDAGVKLMVAENYRFLPTIQKCKEIIGEGSIGNLRLIQVQVEYYGAPTGWRTSATFSGGGVFIDGGIHLVDMLLNIGGFPERVYAARPPKVFHQMEGEDGLVVTAHLTDGAVGLITILRTTSVEGGEWYSVKITGTKGQLSFVPHGNEVIVDTPAGAEQATVRHTVRLSEQESAVRAMVKEFRASILKDREPLMSGEEGLRDLMVVLGAYRSAEQGTAISLGPY